MRIGRTLLRVAWDSARDDAGLDRRDCAIILVKARMRSGAAEAAYYRPGRSDGPHDELVPSVLRSVPPDVLERYESRHRVAIWSDIPGAPYVLLDPLLRHELEHAAQYQRHGRPYSDLDGHLRDVLEAHANPARYLQLPSEREANLAATSYASARLDEVHVRRLRRVRRYRQLVDRDATSLESDSLSLMVQALREVGDRFLPQFDAKRRQEELRNLEENARDWPQDLLEGLRDSESEDLVVTKPYRPVGSIPPGSESP